MKLQPIKLGLAALVGIIVMVWATRTLGTDLALQSLVLLVLGFVAIALAPVVTRWSSYLIHAKLPGYLLELGGWTLLVYPFASRQFH